MDRIHQGLPKIITADLDGTLFLQNQRTIAPRTYQILSRYVAEGVEFVPATGRCEGLIPLEDLPRANYVISCNGALVSDTRSGEILYADYISREHLIAAWRIIRRYDVVLELFVDKDVVIERRILENIGLYTAQIPPFQPQYFQKGRATVVESFGDYIARAGDRVAKINLPGKNIHRCPELVEEIRATGFFEVSSDGYNMEATNRGCNKATGLLRLCEHLGVSPREVVSFGDGDNDIPLLRCVGWGVAMGNADAYVKRCAAHCTAANTEDGIAVFLEKTFAAPSNA